MFHLPKDGATVKVWPAPGVKVADQLATSDKGLDTFFPPHGKLVQWTPLRYEQYLRGELHFHDPRPEKCPTRKHDPKPEDRHPDEEKCTHKAHADELLPEALREQLKEIAIRDGKGRLHKEALEDQAAAKKAAEQAQAAEREAAAKAAKDKSNPKPGAGDGDGSDR